MAAEYLLEIRGDQMPARLLPRALKQLGSRLLEALTERGEEPEEMTTGLTPRRLIVCCRGLPERAPDRQECELGPPLAEAYGAGGEPTEALRGFAERVGAAPEELETHSTDKGEYLAAVRHLTGSPTPEILAEIVPRILSGMNWSGQMMRWGRGKGPWVRPLRGIVSVYAGEVVPFEFAGVTAGRTTAGHPTLSPDPFEVADFDDYRQRLCERGIEVAFEDRRHALVKALRARAAELGGELYHVPGLLDRLALMCEIPGVAAGAFDPEYLALPGEVILATLQQQQSAFVLSSTTEEGRGELLPYFVTVMDRPDDPRGIVRAGQERAAAGRLNDALFQYEADRRLPLAERSRRLDQLSFHPRLGSFAHKTRRVQALVELIAGELGWHDDLDAAREAAVLLKTDLTTAMVRDFGSLRGIMGGIYAREEGYVEAVWQAIYDQYKPATLDESIPRGRSGQLVAVADRLDALVGFFGIGQAPTGSKDPLAMRRRALGLLRILIEAEMPLDLDLIAARAVLLYNDEREGEGLERGAEEILQALQGFLADRLRNLFVQRGFAHDEIEAAMAVGANNLPDLAARLRALRTMREAAEFRSLVLAAKRIFNIVKESAEFELHPELLVEEAEKDLYANLVEVRRTVDEAADGRRYEDCLRHMEELVPSLDRFFAEVLVNDEDETLRHNRMALLQATRRVFWRMARLKEMAVEKADIPSLADTRVLKPIDLKTLAREAVKSQPPEA